ncbi:MAG: formyltetrahydrofolate deformylase [Candidatus Manganitrophaceae bacterium]|nr:MAG: formyltetrahydrofolate deformylase [Candidatus Manganitrophaceae bacterium]
MSAPFFWPPISDSRRDIGRLLISCPDRPGIVAAVSRFLFEQGANIIDSDQHSTDPTGGMFFMRVEFQLSDLAQRGPALEEAFSRIAASFEMAWRLAYAGRIKRLAIFVSKAEHALFELLWHRRAGDLRAEIAMVISNHSELAPTVAAWGVPFHHIPVEKNRKQEAEAKQIALMAGKIDLVVLARYMQIISADFIKHYPHRIINIHHSFLPAFVGADPYARAYERGVKLIGATAHYVTEELDAGPIIEQDVQRVDHRQGVEDLRRIGRSVERTVLARAVSWHVEDRVLVHGNKTIIFS